MPQKQSTLRQKILLPTIAAAAFSSVIVSAASYISGGWIAQRNIDRRFQSIRETLEHTNFPLSQRVLDMMAELSGAQLITADTEGRWLFTTLGSINGIPERIPSADSFNEMKIGGSDYLVQVIDRTTTSPDPSAKVVVLFNQSEMNATQFRTALMPLATGLSTAALLSLVVWVVSKAISIRLHSLQSRVHRFAAGDFDAIDTVADQATTSDELTELSRSLTSMATDLRNLWGVVHKTERERLIHQLAASFAHQIRNRLTGARMGLGIHKRHCSLSQEHSLEVVDKELDAVETYIGQILTAAARPLSGLQPGPAQLPIDRCKDALNVIADHQRVAITWKLSKNALQHHVLDVASLESALNNLVLNAIQAGGTAVEIEIDCTEQELLVQVKDNGPGPQLQGKEDLFDAFVSSKPEGLGLGLNIVRLAAETLGGTASWTRRADQTVFEMTARITHE